MAIRKIAVLGDEVLKKPCKEIKAISERIRVLAGDMVETMIEADGVGLAAPQVGVIKRLFVCRPDLEDQERVYVMINPEILETSGEQESVEGCLSVPGHVGILRRPERVRVAATDLDGERKTYDFTGFAATCIMHEYDHLNGIVYPDVAEAFMTSEEYDELLEELQAEDGKKKRQGKR